MGVHRVLKEVPVKLSAYSVPVEIAVPAAPKGIPQINPSPTSSENFNLLL